MTYCRFCNKRLHGRDITLYTPKNSRRYTNAIISGVINISEISLLNDSWRMKVCDECLPMVLENRGVQIAVSELIYATNMITSLSSLNIQNIYAELVSYDEFLEDGKSRNYTIFKVYHKRYRAYKRTLFRLIELLTIKFLKNIDKAEKEVMGSIVSADIELLVGRIDMEVKLKRAKELGRFTQKALSEITFVSVARISEARKAGLINQDYTDEYLNLFAEIRKIGKVNGY